MDKSEVKEKVLEIIAEEVGCDPDELNGKDDLYDSLGLDSLDAVSIEVNLEKEFNIKLDNEQFLNNITVNDIVSIVENKLN